MKDEGGGDGWMETKMKSEAKREHIICLSFGRIEEVFLDSSHEKVEMMMVVHVQ